MRGFSTMTDDERQRIAKLHSQTYDGYAIGNVQSNMTPLTVYDARNDKEGITVTNTGNVKTYRNHNINEIAAKNLHYDEIDPAYEFDSPGPGDPNLGYDVYSQTIPSYDFDSKGPSDPFYGGGYQTGEEEHTPEEKEFSFDMKDFEDYIEDEKVDDLNESLERTTDMFKRFKKFN
jgi:hypothetical protein